MEGHLEPSLGGGLRDASVSFPDSPLGEGQLEEGTLLSPLSSPLSLCPPLSHSNVQGDSQTSICITIEPGLLLKGDILVSHSFVSSSPSPPAPLFIFFFLFSSCSPPVSLDKCVTPGGPPALGVLTGSQGPCKAFQPGRSLSIHFLTVGYAFPGLASCSGASPGKYGSV